MPPGSLKSKDFIVCFLFDFPSNIHLSTCSSIWFLWPLTTLKINPLDFTKSAEIWKLLRPMIPIQRSRDMSRVQWTRSIFWCIFRDNFNCLQNISTLLSCRSHTNPESRTAKFIGDFPLYPATKYSTKIASGLVGHICLLGSFVATWPYCVEFDTISELLPFSSIPFPFFGVIIPHTALIWTSNRLQRRSWSGLNKNIISKCTHPKSCLANEIQEMKEQKAKKRRRYD